MPATTAGIRRDLSTERSQTTDVFREESRS
jgi:hypothetical protein